MKRAYFWMGIAIIGWGLSTSFVELGLRSYGPIPSLIYRFGLASVLTILILLVTKEIKALQLFKRKLTWVVGILDSVGMVLQYYGQSFGIPSGVAALLMLLYVVWTPLLSRLILKKSLKIKHVVAVFFSLVGLVLLISEGDFQNFILGDTIILGYILLILTSIVWSFYFIYSEIQQQQQQQQLQQQQQQQQQQQENQQQQEQTSSTSNITNTLGNFSSVIIINFFISLFIGVVTLDLALPPARAWIWIGLLAVVSTIIAFFAYYEAIKEIDANLVSLLLLIQIIIPYFIDVVFLNKIYSVWVLLGSLIVLLSAVLAALPSFELTFTNGIRLRKKL